MRGPGVPAGAVIPNLVGNVDLAPTWADLGGAKAPDFVDGRSLVPLLGANPPLLSQWRQFMPLEYGPDNVDATAILEGPPSGPNAGLQEPQDQDQTDAGAQPTARQKKLAIPSFRGVRLQNMSFVIYKTGEIEVYDIKADPYELQNLASKLDASFTRQFSALVDKMAVCKADACRTLENTPITVPPGFTP